MTSIKYRKAEVDGLKVFYREAGRAGAPALLLLHGFPTSGHMFRGLTWSHPVVALNVNAANYALHNHTSLKGLRVRAIPSPAYRLALAAVGEVAGAIYRRHSALRPKGRDLAVAAPLTAYGQHNLEYPLLWPTALRAKRRRITLAPP